MSHFRSSQDSQNFWGIFRKTLETQSFYHSWHNCHQKCSVFNASRIKRPLQFESFTKFRLIQPTQSKTRLFSLLWKEDCVNKSCNAVTNFANLHPKFATLVILSNTCHLSRIIISAEREREEMTQLANEEPTRRKTDLLENTTVLTFSVRRMYMQIDQVVKPGFS